MSKTSKTLATLLILVFLTSLTLPNGIVKAQSKTITVPDDYPTISSAIGNATDGDTILVKKGTYQEQTLLINKTIALIGEGAENTAISCHPQWIPTGGLHINSTGLLEPDYGYDNPIKITGSNVTFSGFKVISDKSGSIFLSSGFGTIIAFNNFTTPITISGFAQNVTWNYINNGTTIIGGEKHVFANNRIINGIYTLQSQLTIINNTFSGNYGIYMGGYDNRIFNNTIQNTDCAIYFWAYAASNSIYGNNFINNLRQVRIGDVYNPIVAKWDDGNIGNYWSDYSGQGVYVINQDNIDHYPLTELYHVSQIPESNLSLLLQIATIAVAVILVIVILSIILYKKHRKTSKT